MWERKNWEKFGVQNFHPFKKEERKELISFPSYEFRKEAHLNTLQPSTTSFSPSQFVDCEKQQYKNNVGKILMNISFSTKSLSHVSSCEYEYELRGEWRKEKDGN